MDDLHQKQANESFPSTRFLVNAYSAGALSTLFWALILPLDKHQISLCFFFGWILTIGAMAIGIRLYSSAHGEDDSPDDTY